MCVYVYMLADKMFRECLSSDAEHVELSRSAWCTAGSTSSGWAFNMPGDEVVGEESAPPAAASEKDASDTSKPI